jgi:hypothetical protein
MAPSNLSCLDRHVVVVPLSLSLCLAISVAPYILVRLTRRLDIDTILGRTSSVRKQLPCAIEGVGHGPLGFQKEANLSWLTEDSILVENQ